MKFVFRENNKVNICFRLTVLKVVLDIFLNFACMAFYHRDHYVTNSIFLKVFDLVADQRLVHDG